MKISKAKILSHWRFDTSAGNYALVGLALVVGLATGFIGSLFRFALAHLEILRKELCRAADHAGWLGWLGLITLGIVGIGWALFLVKRWAPETSGSGVHEIEGALDELRPLRWKRVLPVKFFASLFSLGSGLLLGREGPTIQIGANVGRMIKDLFHRPDGENNALVSAGAAAGLASAFNAPFSGLMFVLEEMHGHFRYSFLAMAAMMVASGAADLVVRFLVGESPVIKMTIFTPPPLSSIWMFVLLGILFGVVGYVFNRGLIFSLDGFRRLSCGGTVGWVIVMGTVLALLGVFYPSLTGGGYETVRHALDESLALPTLAVLFGGRLILTLLSYGIGAPGGIFAPLLALGVVLGILFGNLMQTVFPAGVPQPGVFAVAGMAAIFAGSVRAPVTGIMLAVEMTANFELLLPLIFTAVAASLCTTLLGNQPIYTTLLKRVLEPPHSE